jgi:hypothetical protein
MLNDFNEIFMASYMSVWCAQNPVAACNQNKRAAQMRFALALAGNILEEIKAIAQGPIPLIEELKPIRKKSHSKGSIKKKQPIR